MPQNFARLEISYNGEPTNSLFLNPVLDRIHVLNSCDAAAGATPRDALSSGGDQAGRSLVSRTMPPQPGEVLSVSVVGLGPANGPVDHGDGRTAGAMAVEGVLVASTPG